MDYDYPCNFSRPVSEQLHGNSTNFSGANPRASSFSTYSNSSFGSSSSTYDSSSSSSSSLGQNGGNSSSSSGGHLASPQSPAYVSMGFTATNSARDSSKQSALFSTLLSKHPNAKSSVQLESVVPLVPPKHRAAPGIYYDMPKNIPVDPRWQVPSAGQHFNTTETPKFPVAAISTPNLYDRPQLPEKSSAVQTKQSMLSLIGSSSSSNNSPKPHHHHSTLPVIVGASLKAVPGMSHSMQSVAPPHPPLSVNTSAYMSTVLGFKQSSTAKPLPPLPGKPVSASQVSLLKSTPPPPTPAKPFSSSTVSAAATTYYDVLPAKNTAVSTAYKAAAAAAADDDTTNYDVLPAKNTAVSAYKTAAAADQVDFVGSAKPAVSAASAQPYKFTSIYSKNYVKEAEADDDDDDEDEDCDYDYDYVCLESKKKLDDEDAGIRRIIPRDFQTRYEKLALNSSSSSGGVDLSHLERQMQAHSLSTNNNSRLNTSNSSAVKRQLLASYRQYLATAMANFAQWISLTLEIIERNAQQPSVYINFAKHILLSGQNLLLVAKSLNRHYSQLRSLATFADSFYEYLRVIVLKTKRAAAGAGAGGGGGGGGGGNFDRQAVSEMVDSIKGALRFASHLKVELIQ